MPFKNNRVSKKDTEVACGKTDSEIWKITNENESYKNFEFSEQDHCALLWDEDYGNIACGISNLGTEN